MARLWEKFRSNRFFVDVLQLAIGTVGGRLIYVFATPILARLYAPADFEVLSIYLALVSTVAVAACLRFEIAIPIADQAEDAANLFVLAICSLGCITIVLSFLFLRYSESILHLLGEPDFEPFLLLVPVGVLFSSAFTASLYWATRNKRFGSAARVKLAQSTAATGMSLGLGWAGFAPSGLLVGNLIGLGFGGGRFIRDMIRNDIDAFRSISIGSLVQTFRDFRRFPKYSTFEALINVAGVQVPILLIAANGGVQAGYLFMAMQLMVMPMALLGGSIGQVYLSRASDELREGRLAAFTASIMQKLLQIGVGPLIFLGMAAPVLFPAILGSDWVRSGEIASYMIFWVLLQFLSSPVSMALHVTGNQVWMLLLTVIGFVLRVGIPLTLLQTGQPDYLVEGFVSASTIYYVAVLVFVSRAARLDLSDIRRIFSGKLVWHVALAFALGILVRYAVPPFLNG